MANKVKNTDCPSCQTVHYGHKAVCYEHLDAFEAVTMSVVAVLAVTAGTLFGLVA